MADLKSSLLKLGNNLNILEEREAKYAGHAPLELLNQIDDHQRAIDLTEQAIAGEITEIELSEALKPLILAVANDQVVNIEADTYIAGDMKGDIIGGDKIVTNIYETPKIRIPLQRPPRAEYFTNRRQELSQLLADLQPGRVVTLCGPGGIGKSALAAEAVWTMAPEDNPPDLFPDGILFYSFDNQSQTELALESIVKAFGDEPKPTPEAAAQRALAGRRALLLLESAEEADNLPAVLAVAGGCGVLVTSRKKQDATAERQDMAPLPIDEAIILLQAWGRRQTIDTSAAKRICELIGGLPLAVRLVGRYLDETGETATEYLNWLAETPLEALDPFGEQRRLQSVTWLLKHSLDQVSETAVQVLGTVGLMALAPFSIEPVAEAMAWSARQARQRLGELVSYGLLQRSGDRYEVSHPLIHTYAHQRLMVPIKVISRLTAYYEMFVREKSELGPTGFSQLDVEREHLMRVLVENVKREEWVAIRQFAWTLASIDGYLNLQGHRTERITALEFGLAAAQELADSRNEAMFLGNIGGVYNDLGQVERAIDFYQQALTIAQEIGDRQGEGNWLGNLGYVYGELGELEGAKKCLQQALTIAQDFGDRRGEGNQLGILGNVYRELGQVERAIDYYQQALTIFREIGLQRHEANTLGSLGIALRLLGQVDKAMEHHKQALIIAQGIGDRESEGGSLDELGHSYRLLGQVDKAIEYYQQALGIAREMGDQRFEGRVLLSLGSANRLMERYEEALAEFDRAIELNSNSDWILYERGLIHLAKNTPHQAQNDLTRAIDLARHKYEENSQNWRNTFNLALYSVAIGDVEVAEQIYRKAIEASPTFNFIREAIRDLDEFLDLFPEHGQAQAIRGLLHQSL